MAKNSAALPDIGHAAEPPRRYRGGHLVHVFLAHFDQALGDDVARQNSVDR